VLVKTLKKGLLEGKKAGAVFFDFADAECKRSVNRHYLLLKPVRDFGVRGRLFLHIRSFLTGRFARMKINGECEDWMESIFGTSAGTRLGPLLFIVYVHDVPKSIFSKICR